MMKAIKVIKKEKPVEMRFEGEPLGFGVVLASHPKGYKSFRKQHLTIETAEAEAMRLAKETNQTFFVVEIVAAVFRPKSKTLEKLRSKEVESA
jgi:hypothetical protein